jgi:hypothetical protein
MFTMGSDLVQSVDQHTVFVNDGASQFQNFHVNIYKSVALFTTILSQLGRLSQVLRKNGSENVHECTQDAENGLGSDFFRAIPQRLR